MRYAGGVGAVGLAVAALGWVVEPLAFYSAWLAALILFAAWPLGSMAALLAHALTGGRWGEALRPALFTGVRALPLLVLAAVPLAVGLDSLYPWARPDEAAHLGNRFYLNVPFFAGRAAVYLVVWLLLGWLVLRGRDLERVAPAGLFVLAITTTFAAIDTTMSLDPHFTSSVYGMINAAAMGLVAVAVAILLTAGEVAASTRADFAKLLLALVVLWIYLDFMQLLIVWQSDLASEAPWYLVRSRGGWGAVQVVIVTGHFVLPFFLLLSPRLQRSRATLVGVAGLLLAMEVLRSWWEVLPALGRGAGWIDVACMVGLGGVALAFGRRAKRWTPAQVQHV